MADVERRARDYGLPALVWPDPWPSDYVYAMRATTAAFDAGRGREFTLHAFRDQFQRGLGMDVAANVDAVAAAVGLRLDIEPAKLRLREATQAAFDRGVIGVPTVAVGDELFWGDDRLEEACSISAT